MPKGIQVRLSGQDTERGTFSPAYSVPDRSGNEDRYVPFNPRGEHQARFEVINSMLSEEAVLGSNTAIRSRKAECAHALGGAVRRLARRPGGGFVSVRLLERAQVAGACPAGLPVAANPNMV